MKRSSGPAKLPSAKVRKQAPESTTAIAMATPTAPRPIAADSAPKSILKKPLRSTDSLQTPSSKDALSRPPSSNSAKFTLKANTNAAAARPSATVVKAAGGNKGRVIKQAVVASRGNIMGSQRKRRAKEDKSDDENDGEDEKDSGDEEGSDDDDEEEGSDADDIEGLSAKGATKKVSKKRTEENMALAMTKILGSHVRKADAATPILARSRGAERKIEEEKIEAKARKALTNEKKNLANKDRVKPDYTGMEYEKKLRKVATRGVVQLFNAIKAQQKSTEEVVEKIRPITTNAKDKVANLTKASFLDLLKSGTKVAAV